MATSLSAGAPPGTYESTYLVRVRVRFRVHVRVRVRVRVRMRVRVRVRVRLRVRLRLRLLRLDLRQPPRGLLPVHARAARLLTRLLEGDVGRYGEIWGRCKEI